MLISKDIKKVLIIRIGAIGDVVHTTAVYDFLFNNNEKVSIDYLTSPNLKDLLSSDKRLNNVIPLNEYSYKGFLEVAQNLSTNKYDLVLNLQPSLKTEFFTLLVNKRKVLKYKKYWPNHYSKHIHAVENFLNTLNPIIPNPIPPKKLELHLNKEVLIWVKNKLKNDNIKNLIGIIPGVSDNKKGRLWPNEYWKELLDYICNIKDMNVAIFGGLNEHNLAIELQTINKKNIYNFCGELNLMQTACALSLCNLVIGVDTGPTHIASAVGAKVIGLYGVTAPKRTGIYGEGHKILFSSNDCLFCEKKTCPYISKVNTYSPCMLNLKACDVIKELDSFISF